MKVLIIPSWYHAPGEKGGHFISTQTQALHKTGVDLMVYHSNLDYKLGNGLEHKVTKIDFPFPFWQSSGFFIPRWNRHLFDIWCRINIDLLGKSMKEEYAPDIIHAHSYIGGYLARALSKKYQVPYIVTEHYRGFMTGDIPRRHKEIISATFRDANLITAVSDALREAMLKNYSLSEVRVTPNMVNTDLFTLKKKAVSDPFTFITNGFYFPNKNFSLIVSSFATWMKMNNNRGKLIIIGDAENMSDLKYLCMRLGVEKDVVFTGILSEHQVVQQLHGAHVFISASERETFGLAILEAMSCGLPVISFRSGGPESFVDDKSGELFSDLNKRCLAESMNKVSTQIDSYDSIAIREKVVQNYSISPFSRNWKKLYAMVAAS